MCLKAHQALFFSIGIILRHSFLPQYTTPQYTTQRVQVVAEGVSGFNVTNCTFTRLDNAGIFLGGFARDVVIADNEFSWLGESGIVSVGDTDGAPIPGWGADGRAGNQVMLQLMGALL